MPIPIISRPSAPTPPPIPPVPTRLPSRGEIKLAHFRPARVVDDGAVAAGWGFGGWVLGVLGMLLRFEGWVGLLLVLRVLVVVVGGILVLWVILVLRVGL